MMSEAVLIAIIASTPPTLVALAALIVGILNKGSLETVHVLINSRMSDWIEAVRKLSRAEGRAEGIRLAEKGKNENP